MDKRIKALLLEGKTLSQIPTKELIDLYEGMNLTAGFFNLVEHELSIRLTKEKNNG